MDYFSCSPLCSTFNIGKHEKIGFQKVQNSVRCDLVMSQIDMLPACGCSYLSNRLTGTHMGKINGNLDLVCNKFVNCSFRHHSALLSWCNQKYMAKYSLYILYVFIHHPPSGLTFSTKLRYIKFKDAFVYINHPTNHHCCIPCIEWMTTKFRMVLCACI